MSDCGRTPKKDELIAQRYLKKCGFSDVVYEPIKNCPPDFLCDGRVAVEVRRLNQTFDENGKRHGLEDAEIQLMHRVRKLLVSMGPSSQGRSWFVFYTFRRPLLNWVKLRLLLKEKLSFFAVSGDQRKFECTITPGFEIEVFPATKAHGQKFVFGGYMDDNSGGWMFSEMLSNIALCIEEKARKVEPVRKNYTEWWLVLVDYIAYGQCQAEIAEIQSKLQSHYPFDRVVVISPAGIEQAAG